MRLCISFDSGCVWIGLTGTVKSKIFDLIYGASGGIVGGSKSSTISLDMPMNAGGAIVDGLKLSPRVVAVVYSIMLQGGLEKPGCIQIIEGLSIGVVCRYIRAKP